MKVRQLQEMINELHPETRVVLRIGERVAEADRAEAREETDGSGRFLVVEPGTVTIAAGPREARP